jgi:hypothetical protein
MPPPHADPEVPEPEHEEKSTSTAKPQTAITLTVQSLPPLPSKRKQ